MKLKSKKGYTLIEVITTVSIIGVLVSLLIPQFPGIINEANKVALLADTKTVYTTMVTKIADAFADNDTLKITPRWVDLPIENGRVSMKAIMPIRFGQPNKTNVSVGSIKKIQILLKNDLYGGLLLSIRTWDDKDRVSGCNEVSVLDGMTFVQSVVE